MRVGEYTFVLVAVLLYLSCCCTAQTPPRHVDCTNANKYIDPVLLQSYFFAFANFQQNTSGPRTGGQNTLMFESLIGLALAGTGASDVSEFLQTVWFIQNATADISVTTNEVVDIWSTTWYNLGQKLVADGTSYQGSGDVLSAASAYRRAWLYTMMSERFSVHTLPENIGVYNQAVSYFQTSLSLSGSPCTPVNIPYKADSATFQLNGYWCPSRSTSTGPRATILLQTGYDGTAEMLVEVNAVAATAEGYNVLAFEGPGQGYTVRNTNLTFRYDWEYVVQQVANFAYTLPNVDPTKMVLWGESFGGYLVPRAFSNMPKMAALIANGGIADMYQAVLCQFPSTLLNALYYAPSKFNDIMEEIIPDTLDLSSLVNFGYLGFGVSDPASLFLAFQPYQQTTMSGIGERPVLVYNPQLDFMVHNQSAIFFSDLPSPLHPQSKIYELDAHRGTALHCGVGSSANVVNYHLNWLDGLFATTPLPTKTTPPNNQPNRFKFVV